MHKVLYLQAMLLKELSFQGNIFTPSGSTFVLIGQGWGRSEEIGTDTKKAIFLGNCYFPTKSLKSLRSAPSDFVLCYSQVPNLSFFKFEIARSRIIACLAKQSKKVCTTLCLFVATQSERRNSLNVV